MKTQRIVPCVPNIGPYYSGTTPFTSSEETEKYGVFDSVADPVVSIFSGSIYAVVGVSWDIRFNLALFWKYWAEEE